MSIHRVLPFNPPDDRTLVEMIAQMESTIDWHREVRQFVVRAARRRIADVYGQRYQDPNDTTAA